MNMDITLLVYTANLTSGHFARSIREHLATVSGEGLPIVSVSQIPIDFGENICVGNIGCSVYNIYRQILIGAKAVKTKYLACCEDDCLYNKEHFAHVPEDDTFSYNINRWSVDRSGIYYHRNRIGMWMGIAPTKLMVETLETRFAKYPIPLKREESKGWGEPGRFEKYLSLPLVKYRLFNTLNPILTFNHRPSFGGVRKVLPTDIIEKSLPMWGDASELWKKFYG
jgi:hypothetical protein